VFCACVFCRLAAVIAIAIAIINVNFVFMISFLICLCFIFSAGIKQSPVPAICLVVKKWCKYAVVELPEVFYLF
jgi:hypothetical protein